MPPNWKTVYGEPFDEEKWQRAKDRAKEEGHENDWEYVVGIYKRMARTGEYKPRFSAQRKKRNQTVAAWKEKHPKWQTTARKSMKLVVSHGSALEEFRCGNCGHLLFKGINLEKSMIEVKCQSCKALLVSPAMFVVE